MIPNNLKNYLSKTFSDNLFDEIWGLGGETQNFRQLPRFIKEDFLILDPIFKNISYNYPSHLADEKEKKKWLESSALIDELNDKISMIGYMESKEFLIKELMDSKVFHLLPKKTQGKKRFSKSIDKKYLISSCYMNES